MTRAGAADRLMQCRPYCTSPGRHSNFADHDNLSICELASAAIAAQRLPATKLGCARLLTTARRLHEVDQIPASCPRFLVSPPVSGTCRRRRRSPCFRAATMQ